MKNEMSDFFSLPGLLNPRATSSSNNDNFDVSSNSSPIFVNKLNNNNDCDDIVGGCQDIVNSSSIMINSDGLINREIWSVPMLALATLNVVVILVFEIYILFRAARNTPSRRHLFLGQMLLLGLLLGSILGFAYAVEPNRFSCSAIRIATGLSYGLIYSSLLVKLVFLISLNTGVYLPATYQALLFLFCILVQIVIGIQWLSSTGPDPCDYTTRDHVLTLLYVLFLVLFVTGLAIKSRHYRDNYREAKYIGILMAITIPLWLTWIVASVILSKSLHSACEGFGLLTICSFTFVVMFLPKSRQLSAIGKEGIYLEDQLHHTDDRFSLHSSSDPYAPSFYHFKPNKPSIMPSTHIHNHRSTSTSYKDNSRAESPAYRGGNSYTGFHRPLRVVPPSATPSPRLHNTPTSHAHPPPPYTARTPYFPSHFSPEKLYQYWQYYHPRLPGIYARADIDSLNLYTSLHEQDRTKSSNPNVYFYKSSNYHHPGLFY